MIKKKHPLVLLNPPKKKKYFENYFYIICEFLKFTLISLKKAKKIKKKFFVKMKNLLLSSFFIFHFLCLSYSTVTIYLDVNASSNYTDPTNITYSSCFDFFNGINNQSLSPNIYVVNINSNLSLNGKFSVANSTLNFM